MFTYRFRELQVALDRKGQVREALARELRVHPECIFNLEVERFSLDCRRKGDPKWNYNVIFDVEKPLRVSGNAARGLVEATREREALDGDEFAHSIPMASHVDIVGAGPAGLWAALHLLRRGFTVDLYEQGKHVEERFRDIRRFFVDRKFNAHSNVLFGEGGAGAFSDGKLNTRTRNIFSETVLRDMVEFGIDESVVTFAKPHIGTDRLVLMLRKIRAEIVQLGGKFHFNTALEDIEISDGKVNAIKIRDVSTANSAASWKSCEALVLATGHSARDIYTMLHARGVALESKAFAMGVRVEHPQTLINMRQLGRGVDTRLTGSAEYFLATPTLNKTSSAYSFCMCPGGVLVPCASEPGTLATNGMSYSKRNGWAANGAIVVPVEANLPVRTCRMQLVGLARQENLQVARRRVPEFRPQDSGIHRRRPDCSPRDAHELSATHHAQQRHARKHQHAGAFRTWRRRRIFRRNRHECGRRNSPRRACKKIPLMQRLSLSRPPGHKPENCDRICNTKSQ